jgi:hypothetical protein
MSKKIDQGGSPMEIINELPNPLIIDGANEDSLPRYKEYLERRGCKWEDIPEDEQEEKGRLHIYCPEGTRITEAVKIRPHYTKYTITFPDGGWVLWCRLRKLGTEDEYHSRLVISRFSYDAVREKAPF